MLDIPAPLPLPENEPVLSYAPGSSERKALKEALAKLAGERVDIPHVVGGKELHEGDMFSVRAPHDHALELGRAHHGRAAVTEKAIAAALAAAPAWAATPFEERARVLARAASTARRALARDRSTRRPCSVRARPRTRRRSTRRAS